ncbi:tRNA glutamyl-Q(34) synthetase GluQRS [Thiofilum flexile]|uniref:tRNA glutamyl-Q(34) synthetase GluQRS n=1 Tax=Thiofilum flexile TaxID=125627 RepID=UPI00036D335F|nr:tRNA glutamyl-Q(34) synthetase GluQRS [Thiofilum flexile]
MAPVGRFAPSPTGLLHFGSLVTAVASYLSARSRNGRWLVRIEDLDPPRMQAGAIESILQTLSYYGFEWDGEIILQSNLVRQAAYGEALAQLAPYTYPCYCSRKQLQHSAKQGRFGAIYPDTCRSAIPALASHQSAAIRIKTPDHIIGFHDAIHGDYSQSLHAEIGDFVLKRADGLWAYQLAVVVDDAYQGITEVVRGADLLDNTPRQIYLQQLLGYPTPQYTHIPLVLNVQGEKLSKQTYAPALLLDEHSRRQNLYQALQFLKQNPPTDLATAPLQTIWDWGIKQWNLAPLIQ